MGAIHMAVRFFILGLRCGSVIALVVLRGQCFHYQCFHFLVVARFFPGTANAINAFQTVVPLFVPGLHSGSVIGVAVLSSRRSQWRRFSASKKNLYNHVVPFAPCVVDGQLVFLVAKFQPRPKGG